MAQLGFVAALILNINTNAQSITGEVESCPDVNYRYNIVTFSCDKWEEGKVSDDVFGGKGLECVCAKGYKNDIDETLVQTDSGYGVVIGCTQCETGTAPSKDRSQCLPCDSTTMNLDTPSIGQCTC